VTAYQRWARPVLFRLGRGDAEAAHETTLRSLAQVARRPAAVAALARVSRAAVAKPRTVFGVDFPSPVGLAAGMDKDGRALAAWPALGFGFIEVGTVTAHPQPGNDRPRLFRLGTGQPEQPGPVVADRLGRTGPLPVPLGISLGKSKVTPLHEAIDDYLTSLGLLSSYGDYFAVNVSSPNTPGLRTLQDKDQLAALVKALTAETDKPVLVKLAPDLTDDAIAEAVEVCGTGGAAGIIATNTTLARTNLASGDVALADQPGGLSGRPLTRRAVEAVARIHQLTGGELPIIGVGGISGPRDAKAMFDAGASLIQVYTGLIYQGPGLIRDINKSLA